MGPFKCPDCGVWWAGYEHRCRPVDGTTWMPAPIRVESGGTSTVVCTCPPNRGDMYAGTCPIHDVRVTYTTPREITQ